jgi:hypothetical protein
MTAASTTPELLSADEVRVLLARVRPAGDPSPTTVEAWRHGLAGCTFGAVEAALLALGPNARRTTPSEIVSRIDAAQTRTNRDVAEKPARVVQDRTTERKLHATAGARGIQRVYQVMGWRRHPDHVAARSVACPFCGARPGQVCTAMSRNRAGRMEKRDPDTWMHPSRLTAGRAAGEPTCDSGEEAAR